jgi:hypothetical protein
VAPVVNVFAEPAVVDMDRMAKRFERQMKLLDGSCQELIDLEK